MANRHLFALAVFGLAASTPHSRKTDSIQVQLASPTEQHIIMREDLLQVVPGTSTLNSRDHLFFAGQGIAAIVSHTDHNDIWYVQRLDSGQSAEDYLAHAGYWRETFAFTP